MILAICFLALSVCAPFSAPAQTIHGLYARPTIAQRTDKRATAYGSVVAGSDKGLYRVTNSGAAVPLWTDGRVEQIVRVEVPAENGHPTERWYFRTTQGILFSTDLVHFELKNTGLPLLTIKKYDGEKISFQYQVHELKDICVNPLNPQELVTATKDAVYISRNGGESWQSLGSRSTITTGIKAVAIATMPDNTLAVFMSHSILGLSYIEPDKTRAQWIDVPRGLYMMRSLTSPDEISDILPLARTADDGTRYVELYIAQTYIPRLYRFDWNDKSSECIYAGAEPADSIDGLTAIDTVLLYTQIESLGSLNIETRESPGIPAAFPQWVKTLSGVPGMVNAAWIPQAQSGFRYGVVLNELWMLYPGTIVTPYAQQADGKKSIYVSAYQCRVQSGIDKFRKVISDNNLNSLVIDMKDDYGFLRYDTRDPLVLQKGRITQYKIDLDHFVSEFKQDDVYLIARIVVFKDKNLSQYNKGMYAVWDKLRNAPWVGTKGMEDIVNDAGVVTGQAMAYYDENWVDPYSPEVWEYNIAIAKELVARGFDEIQFDYIRFPTDGTNLRNAVYRWKSDGMDKESALISFLSYARENIAAPISIDIYGANGWYRSSARTGQDAEMMAAYVDVIAPMFYPSHFENTFLNYEPYPDRTYRIYYYGTFRATVLTRNRAIIRPWVQAFRLNVSFDRTYYGPDYIQKEIFGVRDAANRGYMYWNNVGNYENLLPDVADNAPYTGSTPEADNRFRKPAVGQAQAPSYRDEGLSVLDSVLNQRRSFGEYSGRRYLPLLQTPFLLRPVR
ncbi:MAG: hypothetical protein IJ191_00250 [Treponema sp.]|nr:hypothetical protein [Treponema sp.]